VAACSTIPARIRWFRISPGSGSTFGPRASEAGTRMPSPSSTRAFASPSSARPKLLFQNVLREDGSVVELLDANYTFLNQRLAGALRYPQGLRLAVSQGGFSPIPIVAGFAGPGKHPHSDLLSPTGLRFGSAASGSWRILSARPASSAARSRPEPRVERMVYCSPCASRWSNIGRMRSARLATPA